MSSAAAAQLRSPLRDFSILAAVFALASIALTWPLVAGLGDPLGSRDDYLSNLWNFWWMRHAVFELGVSPFSSDWLHYPLGISLARHTLSPLNSLPGGVLGAWVGDPAAYDGLLLFHFWAAALTAGWLARHLTGNLGAATIAGLVYSFSAFHYYYLPQINVATLEWLPLAALCLLRCQQSDRWHWPAAFAAVAAALALTTSYYLVYTAVLGATLWASVRWSSPGVSWRDNTLRLGRAGLGAAFAIVVVAWPLLAETLFGPAQVAGLGDTRAEHSLMLQSRSLDGLGFPWIGPPERVLLTWPSMLGYAALALLALGFREAARQRVWWTIAFVFLILGLGTSLQLGGTSTGFPLPAAWLSELPVLGMLRKADRAFVMVQLCFAMLCAFAWCGVASRLHNPRLTASVFALFVGAIAVEANGWSLERSPTSCSPANVALAEESSIESILVLPAHAATSGANARYGFCQRLHGKKIAQGYVTSLAIRKAHEEQASSWRRVDQRLSAGDGAPLARELSARKVDAVLVDKFADVRRPSRTKAGAVTAAPFFWNAQQLVSARLQGPSVQRPAPSAATARRLAAARSQFGDPVLEDESIAIFRTKARP